LANIYDIAKKASVSTATVSRVINHDKNVSDKTRKKILKILEEENYVFNANAGSLRRKKTQIIAIIVPDIKNPYFNNLASGIEEKAFDKNYNVIFCSTYEDLNREEKYMKMLIEKRIAGVIIIPATNRGSHLKIFNEKKIPLVFLDRKIIGIEADCVVSDDRNAAKDLTCHLLKLGYKKIAIINCPTVLSTGKDRLDGYLDALEESKITAKDEYIKEVENNEISAYNILKEMMSKKNRPEAVFTTTNSITKGVIKAIHEKGLVIPNDIALVCFDGIETYPFLTACEQHAYLRGGIACDLIIDRVEKNNAQDFQNVILKTVLDIRESCGCKIRKHSF